MLPPTGYNQSDLKLVVLNCPYDYYNQDSAVRHLLSETWKLKLDGYRAYFPYGVLPIDHLDFISNHLIICKVINNELKPVSAWKSLTYDKCLKYDVKYPAVDHIFKNCKQDYPEHILAIEEWVASHDPTQVAYNFGFTVDPTLPREVKSYLVKMSLQLITLYYYHEKINNMLHSTSQTFKIVDEFLAAGHQSLTYNGNELPNVFVKSYNNVENKILLIKDGYFNENYIKETASQWKSIWESRLVIHGPLATMINSKTLDNKMNQLAS
jgi:hypothetical protein